MPWYAWIWLIVALAVAVGLYVLIFAQLGMGWFGTIATFGWGALAFFGARHVARRRR